MKQRLALVLLAACADGRAPTATVHSALFGEVLALPPDHELEQQRLEALALKRLEDLDRALDAKEPGEQLEHATLSQIALDREVFGVDDLFRVGDDLFAYQFRPEQGLGNALAGRPGILAGSALPPNMQRVHRGGFGGPDAASCADCHSVGGDDGAGALTQNAYFFGDGDRTTSADTRSAPALLGVGPLERLAAEMTAELAAQRDLALATAATTGGSTTSALSAKGLAFGMLVAHPDGRVDTTRVTGVAADLVVRPFGWKGHHATVRGMVRESFRIHLGIVSMADQQAVRDGLAPAALFGDGPWYDVDADGTTIEVEDGMVSTMVAYLAQLEVPIVVPPADPAQLDSFARGRAVFDELACASCHTPSLPLHDPVLVTRAEQTEHQASPPVVIDVARDGVSPKVEPVDLIGSAYRVHLFSDLRRHDLGPALAAPAAQSAAGGPIAAGEWLTRPLWGLADSAPYLHDGRAPTISDAILAHDGEARESRDRFAALSAERRADVLVYLLSLQRVRRLVAR